MKRKNVTRSALFTSIISLLLCVSMLVGTTFAWFTDEVVTGMNTIAAGNLDVELYANGEQVKADTPLFELAAPNLWEPGVVAYENLQVANVGTLALKYQMTLNFGKENDLNGHKLSEVLKVVILDQKIEAGATRAQVLELAKAALAADQGKGTLSNFYLTGELEAGTSSTERAVVIFWAPNDNATDNLYNANNDKTTSDGQPLRIEFGVNLQATQKMSENDSFGSDYDEFSSILPKATVNNTGAKTVPVFMGMTATELALDTSFQFLPNETQDQAASSEYKYWHADYVISADKNVPAGSIALAGYYEAWCGDNGWVVLSNDGEAITAGTEIRLVEMLGETVNYNEICQYGNDDVGFLCGAADLTGENDGTTITVELRLYETTIDPSNPSGTANEETGYYEVIGTYSYTFGTVEVSTVAELEAAMAKYPARAIALRNCSEPTEVVDIPDTYTGTVILDNSSVASVQAAGVVNLAIEGNVNIQNANGSAITGTEINISGNGNLTAIANGKHAYGIGGDETSVINVEGIHIVDIKGGFVKAAITDNNYGKNEPEGGAAIGSGKDGAVITLKNVTIDNAQGGSKAAGIGALYHTGVTVNIVDSTIKNVEGGTSSAGIGGSRMTKHESGDTQNITINISNSTINAKGGDFAAGIGSGYNTYCSAVTPDPVISVTIDVDSIITAQGGLLGAGIGTGHNALGFVGNIACDTSNVKAGSSEDPAWCCWGNPTTTAEDIGLGVLSIKNFPDKFGTYVTSADELTNAIDNGASSVYLGAGTYTIPASAKGKTLTISGNKDAVIAHANQGEDGMNYNLEGSTVVFNGVTIKTTSGTYRGFARSTAIEYNNCYFVGTYTLGAGSHTFNDCHFNLQNNYVWTWGGTNVVFDGCTFEDENGIAKAILVHNTVATNVTVKDCTFTASKAAYTWDGLYVAAVSIDPNGENQVTVNFEGTNNVVTGDGATADEKGNTGFAGLHQIKYADETSKITVKINGEVVDNIVAADYNPNL